MNFSFPLGFLILLFIPVLIIIYILKNKYTEQTIASTYLWELSERFLKRKRPISRIYGLLSLILQCLAVLAIALAVAHPKFTIPNGAYNMCFVLDASGSMNMSSGEKTRFELGKEKIAKLIDDAADNSKFTLIAVESTTNVIYEQNSNKKRAIDLLNELKPTGMDADCLNSLSYAQTYFDEHPDTKTYLITDKTYDVQNVNVLNVYKDAVNFGITDVNTKILARKLNVTGKIKSYGGAGAVNLAVYIGNKKVYSEAGILVNDLDEESFNIENIDINEDYQSIRVVIETEDAYAADNEFIKYNLNVENNYRALLCSSKPFYLNSILNSLGISVTVIDFKEYDSNKHQGYGLYVFDSEAPVRLPSDGTVWLFNIAGGDTSNLGFSFKSTPPQEAGGTKLDINRSSMSSLKALKKDLVGSDLRALEYHNYGLISKFTTLYSCNGSPVIFYGQTTQGNREVVFGFNLSRTNLPLSMDYLILMRNFVSYSFPTALEKNNYVCGDKLLINVTSGVTSIAVTAPGSTSAQYLDSSSEIAEYDLTETGTYEVVVSYGDDIKRFKVFASSPEAESLVKPMKLDASGIEVTEQFYLVGTPRPAQEDGIYQSILYLFIIIGIIFIIEWMVYCYEQYKLR